MGAKPEAAGELDVGGSTPSAPEWVRDTRLMLRVRSHEQRELEAIAECWGVPVATAAWAILADALASFRQEGPLYDAEALGCVAAAHLAHRTGACSCAGDE